MLHTALLYYCNLLMVGDLILGITTRMAVGVARGRRGEEERDGGAALKNKEVSPLLVHGDRFFCFGVSFYQF